MTEAEVLGGFQVSPQPTHAPETSWAAPKALREYLSVIKASTDTVRRGSKNWTGEGRLQSARSTYEEVLPGSRLFASGGHKWKQESFQPEKVGMRNCHDKITK